MQPITQGTEAPFDGAPDAAIDITAEQCPMTYVRTRIALDRLRPGQILAVRLRGAEAAENVPRNAMEQGHDLLALETASDGTVLLMLRKSAEA